MLGMLLSCIPYASVLTAVSHCKDVLKAPRRAAHGSPWTPVLLLSIEGGDKVCAATEAFLFHQRQGAGDLWEVEILPMLCDQAMQQSSYLRQGGGSYWPF